jgi:hypothetical protein
MNTRAALLAVLATAALTATACDNGGTKTAEAPAPAAAPPPPPAAPPPPPPPPAEIPGLSVPFATEADFVTGCTDQKLDKGICECVAKAVVKEVGAKGLYTWVWEGYVQRVGMGKVRSDKWFTDNALDKKAQQKFADAVGLCYSTK